MTYPVTIVAAVVDTRNLTMYRADGETIVIPQGDPRIRDLVQHILAAKLEVKGNVFTLTSEMMDGKNHYVEAEKKTNGLVRFFKMAKSKFKELAEKFCEPVKPMSTGSKPVMATAVTNEHKIVDTGDGLAIDSGQTVDEFLDESFGKVEELRELPPEDQRPLTQGELAVAEIMANAVPATDANFQSVRSAEQAKDTGEEEEIVLAVTQDNKVVHGVEQLADQMAAVAAGVTSATGMQLFLERAASVSRGHSVEDLLKFVQKGELPFADDGTVLVYKRLKSTGEEGVYVDCHSGKVKQRVGSVVHMAEHLVDKNRSQECSNGLHVARRDYLSSFSGDITVLAKLAPEDVIAVPHRDARKLRAKGYHIIAVLSKEDAQRVCSNQPMQDTQLLANCVAGNHAPILEYVEITQHYGGGLKVTKVETPEQRAAAEVREVSSLDNLPELSAEAAKVDAREIALDLAKEPAAEPVEEQKVYAPPANMVVESDPLPTPAEPVPVPVHKLSERDQLLKAFNEASTPAEKIEAAKGILAFKKAKKKSWTALGIEAKVWTKCQEIVEAADVGCKNSVTKSAPSKNDQRLQQSVKQAKAGKAVERELVKPQTRSASINRKAEAAPAVKEKKMTQQEQMAKLVKLYEANPDKANARAIFAFKQKSKKSWEVLGVTDVKFQKKITERAKL